jgi:hypothetical protein
VYKEKKDEVVSRKLFDDLDDFGDDKSGSIAVVLCGSMPLLYSCRYNDIRHTLAADVFPGLNFATDLNDTKYQPQTLRCPAPTDIEYMRSLLIASGYNALSVDDAAIVRRILFTSGVNGRAAQLRVAADVVTAAEAVPVNQSVLSSIITRARADLAPVHPIGAVSDLLANFQTNVLRRLAAVNSAIVSNCFLLPQGGLNVAGIDTMDWDKRFQALKADEVATLWKKELADARLRASEPFDRQTLSRALNAREATGLCAGLYVPDTMTEDVYPLTMLHMVMSLELALDTRSSIETAIPNLFRHPVTRVPCRLQQAQ